MKRIYLDNAATTPIEPRVLEKMFQFASDSYGNPSSTHSFGRKSKVALEEAREVCAEAVNADPSEIYFTSGGTEANNFLVKGIANYEIKENHKNTIACSKGEHHSVLDTMKELASENFDHLLLELDMNSRLKINEVDKLNEKTSLLSVMYINNETGIINPIDEIAKRYNDRDFYFHTDAVQRFGKYVIDVQKLGVDALTVSAHKIGGPKGIGFAYLKVGTPVQSLLLGGSQEKNRRGGTENLLGIIGLAKAIKVINEERKSIFNHVSQLNAIFIKNLTEIDSENIFINKTYTSPFITSVTFNPEFYKNDLESMLMFLDINGLAVSSGSACSSGTTNVSHVLMNSGKTPDEASGTFRFSFWKQNTLEEIEKAAEVMNLFVKNFAK